MARRLHQTLADYVVLAISPALIMTLVGSLVFFLLAVVYQGEFASRLHWVMACFVFAAVLIGRISIEEGFERAAMFGIALAIPVGVAANRFMAISGTWIDSIGWLVNWGLIALIWWCAHRLTWDCTLIDDSQDASGEGLLQTAGLDGPRETAPEGVTETAWQRAVEGAAGRARRGSLWQRYLERQRRPHAPGLWVVYFSLAALPLFGIGQWFIPAANLATRRYAFWLLGIYVASGLGLLLTTSFLGLRRYLRQRRIEMPTLMANLWLGTGAVLIAGLLVVSALLPRPSAEYAISSLPFQVGSPTQKASAHAPIAREGTPDEQPGPAPDARPEAPPNPDANAPRPQPGAGSSPSKSAESSAPSDNQQNSAAPNGQSQQPSSQGQPSPDAAASDSRSGDDASKSVPSRDAAKSAEPAKSPEPSQSQPDHSQPEPTKSPDAPSRPAPKSDFAKGLDALQQKHPTDQLSKAEPEPTKPDSAKTNPASDASSPEPSPPDPESLPAAPPPLAPGISSLGDLAKWIFYGLVILAAAFVAWRSRLVLLGILREFLSFWQNLFLGLWGRSAPRSVAAATADEIEFPPVPFSSFTDPFASGTAARYSATDLVCYSFAAFEAWSREHGCPRDPQQTPHELATRVAAHHQFLRAEARSAAELYARAAYARGELPPGSGEQMRALWQKMGSAAASTPHDSPLD